MLFHLAAFAFSNCYTPSPSEITGTLQKRDGMVKDMVNQYYETNDYEKGTKYIINKLKRENIPMFIPVNWFYMGKVNLEDFRNILTKVATTFHANGIPIEFYLNHTQAIQGHKIEHVDKFYQQQLWDEYAIKEQHILNIFSGEVSENLGGWSTFPGNSPYAIFLSSPAVFREDEQHGIGIITHELGHWLGLYHTFDGGCFSIDNDFVKDTPRTDNNTRQDVVAWTSYTWECDTQVKSCSKSFGNDLVNNVMDYTNCQMHFTLGQRYRMMNFLYWRFTGKLPSLQ
eukprot:NODE_210_length_12844_cov_1.045822.p5 type:complete len:284 gc:universal NODE_210_length_12844_cov_1.045822:1894-2745(+)